VKEKLAKLIDVKSIVTLTLTGVMAYLSISGKEVSETFKTIYVMIIGFYFGTQHEKNQKEDKKW
jgi:biotin transporter BioY